MVKISLRFFTNIQQNCIQVKIDEKISKKQEKAQKRWEKKEFYANIKSAAKENVDENKNLQKHQPIMEENSVCQNLDNLFFA